MGNAIYRDLVQALVMVEVDNFYSVPHVYRYQSGGRLGNQQIMKRQLVSLREYLAHTFPLSVPASRYRLFELPTLLTLLVQHGPGRAYRRGSTGRGSPPRRATPGGPAGAKLGLYDEVKGRGVRVELDEDVERSSGASLSGSALTSDSRFMWYRWQNAGCPAGPVSSASRAPLYCIGNSLYRQAKKDTALRCLERTCWDGQSRPSRFSLGKRPVVSSGRGPPAAAAHGSTPAPPHLPPLRACSAAPDIDRALSSASASRSAQLLVQLGEVVACERLTHPVVDGLAQRSAHHIRQRALGIPHRL